jgi:hypothetical protein
MCNRDGESAGVSLEELTQSIEGFVTTPVALTSCQLGEHLIQLRHGIDLLELGFARAAATFAATDEYETQGSTTPIDWIRHQCRMSGNAAARSVATGEQAEHLPASVAAVTDGRIGFAHLALLAGTARAVQSARQSFDEGPLLKQALEHSVSRFGFDCSHARHAADAAGVLEEQVNAVEHRRLELIRCADGRVVVRGIFDPVAGAVIRVAVASLSAKSGVDDERPLERRQADALEELAMHTLDHGFATDRGGPRTHLQLTASVETVMGMTGAPGGDLEFAGVVPAATVQRLACDASIRRVLLGPGAAVIEVGRALRVPSGAGRSALRVRDQGCVWPGCERPSSWTNAHHLLHWAHGGDTNLENLVLLCHRHHWSVHEGGWQLTKTEAQRVIAIPPTPTYRSWARAPVEVGPG